MPLAVPKVLGQLLHARAQPRLPVRRGMRLFVSFIVLGAVTIPAFGQQDTLNHRVPIYRVTVVQRSLQAVNFQRHSGPTEIDLKGTVLLPKTEGKAIVEVKNGYTKIDLNIKHLAPPTQFGAE